MKKKITIKNLKDICGYVPAITLSAIIRLAKEMQEMERRKNQKLLTYTKEVQNEPKEIKND